MLAAPAMDRLRAGITRRCVDLVQARVDVTHAAIGMAPEIGKLDGHQMQLPARVVALSQHDPKELRMPG